jgi:hypothetical protein
MYFYIPGSRDFFDTVPKLYDRTPFTVAVILTFSHLLAAEYDRNDFNVVYRI